MVYSSAEIVDILSIFNFSEVRDLSKTKLYLYKVHEAIKYNADDRIIALANLLDNVVKVPVFVILFLEPTIWKMAQTSFRGPMVLLNYSSLKEFIAFGVIICNVVWCSSP